MAESPVPHGSCCFFCVTIILLVAANVITDLRQEFAVNVLKRQPAVADHLAGFFETYRPQAEAVLLITLPVSKDPLAHPCFVKRVRIVLHVVGIRQNGIERLKIIRIHLAKHESIGFQKKSFHNFPQYFAGRILPADLTACR